MLTLKQKNITVLSEIRDVSKVISSPQLHLWLTNILFKLKIGGKF